MDTNMQFAMYMRIVYNAPNAICVQCSAGHVPVYTYDHLQTVLSVAYTSSSAIYTQIKEHSNVR